MGSRMTTMPAKMRQIFSVLKKNKLYFVDSRTTKYTLCRNSACMLNIKFAERDIFLDHIKDYKTIKRQLKRLVRKAYKDGTAIGIGHPYKETYKVLKEELQDIEKQASLVLVSEIVEFAEPSPSG